jgi:dUTPase
MKVHFKKLVQEAQTPKFGKSGDAGADLVATSIETRWKDDDKILVKLQRSSKEDGNMNKFFPTVLKDRRR